MVNKGEEVGAPREASPIKLEIRYHGAMPRWCKVDGLRVKAVHECEGGGFAIDKDQAEYLVKAYNAHDALVTALASAVQIIRDHVPEDALGFDDNGADGPEAQHWPRLHEAIYHFDETLKAASLGEAQARQRQTPNSNSSRTGE